MTDLSSLEKFNHLYEHESERAFELSLQSFFHLEIKKHFNPKGRILDLGPGSKSLFEDENLDHSLIDAFDFSSVAVAKGLSYGKIRYQEKDISLPNSLGENTYDLIFDSHCLHCITNEDDRRSAFKNIYQALTDSGIFSAEMMVQSSSGRAAQIPYKHVPNSRELEEELLRHGFKIKYYMIVRNLSFDSEFGECDLLRVIATK